MTIAIIVRWVKATSNTDTAENAEKLRKNAAYLVCKIVGIILVKVNMVS